MSPKIVEGQLSSATGTYAIIAAKFNGLIVDSLLKGAIHALSQFGIPDSAIEVFRVPGSFEIPLVVQKLSSLNRFQAFICLGAVIKGDTDHYDYVSSAATSGIMQVTLKTDTPVIFGILTCDSMDQALDRAGGKAGNKGYEAATTAIEMVSLIKQIEPSKKS